MMATIKYQLCTKKSLTAMTASVMPGSFSADFVKLGSKGRHNLNHHDGYNNDNNKNSG
mgnify:CR=1 FL=1